MLKKAIAVTIAIFLMALVTAAMAAATKEGEEPPTPVVETDVPTLAYKDFVFTVESRQQSVSKVGYMLFPYPKKPYSTPVLEGHLPLSQVGPATYKTPRLDTSGAKSGKYVLAYWVECKGSRSIDIVNLDKPSPKNTVYKTVTVTVKTKTVNTNAPNRAVGKLMVVRNDNTQFYLDSKLKEPDIVLDSGEVMEIAEEKASYAKVLYNGANYYVKSKYLRAPDKFAAENPAKGVAAKACAAALKLRGSTYLWGADGTQALDGMPVFDCSGMTYYAYRAAGLEWARTTAVGQSSHEFFDVLWRGNDPMADIANYMIVWQGLKPGDIIFFQTSASPSAWRKNITHCGLYIGNGKMVHAGDPVHVENVEQFSMPVPGEVETVRIRAITRLRQPS